MPKEYTITKGQVLFLRDSLDDLGLALIEENHKWSEGLRNEYEEAIKLLELIIGEKF